MSAQARIVIVEDEALLLRNMEQLLQRSGYETFTAASPFEGLALVRDVLPDIVLLDVLLPKLDGFEVCRRIKADPHTAHIFVVLLSSLLVDSTAQTKGLNTGADGYIIRPIPDQELLARIQTFARLKTVEDRLRKSEERFRMMADFAYDWEYWVGTDHQFVYMSPSCERLTGYSAPAFLNDPGLLMCIIHADDRSAMLHHQTSDFQQPHQTTLDFRITTPEGEERWFEHLCQPIYSQDGRWLGRRVTNRDISDRKRAEADAQESHEQLVKFASQVPGMLYQFERRPDGSFRVPYTTEAIRDIFDCSPEDVREDFSPVARRIHPDDRGRIMAQIEESFRQLRPFRCEYRVVRQDRSCHWVLAQSIPEKLPNGSVVWSGLNTDITEQKQTEETLREKEHYNRTLFNDSPIGLALCRMDGTLVDVNQAFADIIGYSIEETLRLSYWQITPEQYAEQEKIQLDLLNLRARYGPYEKEYIHRDGHLVPVRLNGLIITLQGEKFIWSSVENITARKHAEDALRQSEEKFRRIFQHHPALMMIVDMKTLTILDVNQAYSLKTGYAPEDALHQQGKAGFMLDPVQQQELFEMMRSSSRLSDVEVALHTRSGKLLNVLVYAEPITIQSRQMHIVSIVDISAQKQSELALRESEQRFRALFEQAAVGVALIQTATGQYLQVNRKYSDIVGYRREELKGRDFMSITHPDDLIADQEHMEALKSGRLNEFSREKRYIHKNGSIVWASVTVSPMWQPGEASTFHVAIVQDITARKQAEDALYRLNAELEQRIRERTADLRRINSELHQEIAERRQVEEALVEAKEAAEAANRAKSEFLAMMSHELRTPLNSILGYAQLLSSAENFTAKQQESIRIMHHSGKHLLTLINDILDLSKIEAGRLDLNIEPFSLPAMLSGLIDMIKIRAEQRGLTFKHTPLTDVPFTLIGDEKRLRQVLLNLLGNAVKFTKSGNVELRIHAQNAGVLTSCKTTAKPALASTPTLQHFNTSILRFEVADTGISIPKEHLDAIFRPFQQLRDRRLSVEGTGLGLAISQRLVHKMGGTLHVESVPSQGTRFWFDLELPQSSKELPTSTASAGHIIGYPGPRRRVLIADDHPENRQVLRDMLTPLDFHVVEATDGATALRQIQTDRPDILLIDTMMPGMNGLEVARRIRRIPDLNGLRIVMISASAFASNKEESQAAGCDAFIAKPVQIDALLHTIGGLLQLEWIIHQPEAQETKTSDVEIVYPSHNELVELFQAAEFGSPSQIRQWLGEMQQRDPAYAPFLKQIRDLTDGFRLDDICTLVQRILE